MLQLVQYPNASALYLTRVLLADTMCAADTAACTVTKCLGPLLNPGSLERHKLCRRYCSLFSLRTLRAFIRHGFSWQARTVAPMLQLVQSTNASGLNSTKVLLAHTNRAADAAAYARWLDSRCSKCNSPVTRSCSKLPRRSLPEGPSCVRRAETKALNL